MRRVIKQILAVASLGLALYIPYKLANKTVEEEKVTPVKEVKYEYSIGENLMHRAPVKYCHIMNGTLYVQMNDVLTFTTTNPALICIQQSI